jgi:phenylpyruvate tautomerase PptA (4-oxalocrotonate tautomerase family)
VRDIWKVRSFVVRRWKGRPMPILDVEIVTRPGEELGNLAAEIAERAGVVFGSAPQQTWVKLRALAPEQYAENGGPLEGTAPVFVSVLKAHIPAPELLQAEVTALVAAVAAACARPIEHVHKKVTPL